MKDAMKLALTWMAFMVLGAVSVLLISMCAHRSVTSEPYFVPPQINYTYTSEPYRTEPIVVRDCNRPIVLPPRHYRDLQHPRMIP